MRIDLMDHRDLVRGAAEVEETPEGVRSSRLTESALEFCQSFEEHGNDASFSAGVRIAFVTDSRYVKMKLAPCNIDTVKDYQIDVLVDRSECHTFAPEDPEEEFVFRLDFPDEDEDKEEFEVEIFLPITTDVEIRKLELADGALFRPIYCCDEQMLFLGGATIMGHGASSPVRSCSAHLAAQMDIDHFNWGIGTIPLSAELGEFALELEWQRVVIFCDAFDFLSDRNAEEFADELAAMLDHIVSRPGVMVHVVSPLLWRDKEESHNAAGSSLDDFRLAIRRAVSSFP